mgnify:CR=1 FL=1
MARYQEVQDIIAILGMEEPEPLEPELRPEPERMPEPVAAVLAALGTGLGSMVGKLTFGVRKFEALDARNRLGARMCRQRLPAPAGHV